MTLFYSQDGWVVSEKKFSLEHNRKFEGLFAIGSGYLHLRASLEEHIADAPQNVTYNRMPANVTSEKFPEFKARWGTYVPGIYGTHPLLCSELINLPWFAGWAPLIDGTRLDLSTARFSDYDRSLHLKEARIARALTWHVSSEIDVCVSYDSFVSAVRPGLLVQRMTLTPNKETQIDIQSNIDGDVRTNGYDHLNSIQFQTFQGTGVACVATTDQNDHVEIRSQIFGGSEARYLERERVAEVFTSVLAHANTPVVFEKYTVVGTSQDEENRNLAAELSEASSLGYEKLLEEHAADWRRLWEQSDVVVEGDKDSQLAMRVSVYHLLRSHPRNSRVAIDAKGYAGEGYFGRFFWDTEMYLVPFFLYTEPEKAIQLMDFRTLTLDAACQNAEAYGYPGARYAWESDKSGLESCAVWQYRDHEIHVTADIAYAFAHIACSKGRASDVSPEIAKVLVEAARYWIARIDYVGEERLPSLLGVMGPDEYSPITHNNAYTNRMVKFALDLAAQVGTAGGASAEEIHTFQSVSESLPILKRADGLVLQHESFEKLAEPNFSTFWNDRGATYASQVPQERLYRSKNLKQADVLMMMFLFATEFSDTEVRQAWDYYLPYTTHDSSLSAAVHSILACRLKDRTVAWDLWKKGCGIDIDFEHGAAAEGVHIAACGGNWMNMVFGFAGISPVNQSVMLSIDPLLPEPITKLSFPLVWRGTRIQIDVTPTTVTVVHKEGGEMELVICGEKRCLKAGGEAQLCMTSACA